MASVQLAPVLGDVDGQPGADRPTASAGRPMPARTLVVVPELASSGYVFSSPARPARRRARVRGARPWVELARATGAIVAGGFAELAGDGTVFELGRDRRRQRGTSPSTGRFTCGTGSRWSSRPAPRRRPSSTPPWAGSGCASVTTSSSRRSRARWPCGGGADLRPANWPDEGRPPASAALEVVRAMAAASSSKVFIACADRCGSERGVAWVGGSAIVADTGWLLAGPPAAPAACSSPRATSRGRATSA